jgi:hypothetical protein
VSNLVNAGLGLARRARDDHVGLQEGSFEKHVGITKGAVALGHDKFCPLDSDVKGVLTVHEDLGLNDGNKTIVLKTSQSCSS